MMCMCTSVCVFVKKKVCLPLIRLISHYCSPDVTSFNNQTCRENKYCWMERRPLHLPVTVAADGQYPLLWSIISTFGCLRDTPAAASCLHGFSHLASSHIKANCVSSWRYRAWSLLVFAYCWVLLPWALAELNKPSEKTPSSFMSSTDKTRYDAGLLWDLLCVNTRWRSFSRGTLINAHPILDICMFNSFP